LRERSIKVYCPSALQSADANGESHQVLLIAPVKPEVGDVKVAAGALRYSSCSVGALGVGVVADLVGQVADYDLPQPGQPLGVGPAPKLREVAVCFHESFLEQVRVIELALEPMIATQTCQQLDIVAVALPQPAPRFCGNVRLDLFVLYQLEDTSRPNSNKALT
jgi:hypothetical protein